ncbi:hypothetical protein R6Q57_005418 [Mikania cordata]
MIGSKTGHLNEEPPVEYSYGTIDLNAEPNADVGFDSQASYGFVYDDSTQSNPEEVYEEKLAASNVNWETKEGLPLDPETLALSQHEWLQFEPQLAAVVKCRRIIRMSMGTPRCIDWGVLADCGEAVRARAILGEDTPWTRLFELAELPMYMLITVEFLSTFRYRAHQAVVRAEDDAELPPDIEFSLGGQHIEMSIERLAMHLGIYYKPETVLDDFAQGLTQGEEGVMRAWWAQISDTPFTGH